MMSNGFYDNFEDSLHDMWYNVKGGRLGWFEGCDGNASVQAREPRSLVFDSRLGKEYLN